LYTEPCIKYWTKEQFLVSGGFIVLKNESGMRKNDGKYDTDG